jgi:hypothetical protein
MGTWGPGPFDSDNAADFAGNLRAASDRQARADILMMTFKSFVTADLELDASGAYTDMANYSPGHELDETVAAAAFVADAVTGTLQFTDTPFARGVNRHTNDLNPPVELDEPTVELKVFAVAALVRALDLTAPDTGAADWRKHVDTIRAAILGTA